MFTFHYVMVFISNSYIVTFCTYSIDTDDIIPPASRYSYLWLVVLNLHREYISLSSKILKQFSNSKFSLNITTSNAQMIILQKKVNGLRLRAWCLTSLSTIFQLSFFPERQLKHFSSVIVFHLFESFHSSLMF